MSRGFRRLKAKGKGNAKTRTVFNKIHVISNLRIRTATSKKKRR